MADQLHKALILLFDDTTQPGERNAALAAVRRLTGRSRDDMVAALMPPKADLGTPLRGVGATQARLAQVTGRVLMLEKELAAAGETLRFVQQERHALRVQYEALKCDLDTVTERGKLVNAVVIVVKWLVIGWLIHSWLFGWPDKINI